MKTSIKILSLLLTLVFVLPIFTACDFDIENSFLSNFIVFEEEGAEVGGKQMVTIQWVQGQKVLKEEIVEKGTKLTPWTPTCEGMEFQEWYEKPYIKRFDFSKPITKSIRIYAYFTSDSDIEDGNFEVPDWYLIGAGKGDLGKCNNWTHEYAAKYLGLKAGEDGIYRVTLSLYEGDAFKMARNLSWDNTDDQRAIDKMNGFADGVVKNAEGQIVFTQGDNNNLVVAEGMDGKYEISYDPISDTMDFKFIEELPPIPDDIRLIGDNNGWSELYGEEDYKFTSEDGVNWTYTWEITSAPAPVEFKVYNNSSGNYYPGGVDNNLHIDVEGTYTIHFNSKTRVVVVKDANGNNVDVGFTAGGNEGGDNGGGSTDNPYVPTTDTTIYFVPNAKWLADGARFAVYYWSTSNTSDNNWVDLIAGDNGIYSATVPAGYGNVIFCRMNSNAAENIWNNKWNQTENLYILESGENYFVMYEDAMDKEDGKDTGAWGTNATVPTRPSQGGNNPSDSNGPALTETITVYFENNWLWTNVSCHYWGGEGFVGTEWPGQAMTVVGTRDGHDVYAIELPVGVTGFMFTGNKDTAPNEIDKSPDIPTTALGNGNAWKMDWADGNLVTPITYDPNGEVPNPGTPDNPGTPVVPAEGTALYLVPGVWADGSLMGAWVWATGSDGSFISVIDSNADGIYEVVVPTGCDNIIFVDFKPGTTTMDWNNKANQTSNLKVPTDDNIYYHANACIWKNNAEPEKDAADVYTVAGAAGLCGEGWSTGATQNDMTYDEATGVYTKVFTNVAPGTYEYKVVLNHNWGTGEFPTSGNYSVTVGAGQSTVTVTWNPATQTLDAVAS